MASRPLSPRPSTSPDVMITPCLSVLSLLILCVPTQPWTMCHCARRGTDEKMPQGERRARAADAHMWEMIALKTRAATTTQKNERHVILFDQWEHTCGRRAANRGLHDNAHASHATTTPPRVTPCTPLRSGAHLFKRVEDATQWRVEGGSDSSCSTDTDPIALCTWHAQLERRLQFESLQL